MKDNNDMKNNTSEQVDHSNYIIESDCSLAGKTST